MSLLLVLDFLLLWLISSWFSTALSSLAKDDADATESLLLRPLAAELGLLLPLSFDRLRARLGLEAFSEEGEESFVTTGITLSVSAGSASNLEGTDLLRGLPTFLFGVVSALVADWAPFLLSLFSSLAFLVVGDGAKGESWDALRSLEERRMGDSMLLSASVSP